MGKRKKDLFARRLAGLLLAQAGILPRQTLGLQPKKERFQSVGEILKTEAYWQKKVDDWSKNSSK